MRHVLFAIGVLFGSIVAFNIFTLMSMLYYHAFTNDHFLQGKPVDEVAFGLSFSGLVAFVIMFMVMAIREEH